MSRRQPGPIMPRSSARSGGGLDTTVNRLPLLLIGGAVVVALVALVLAFTRCGGGTSGQASTCAGGAPAPPPGYSYASKCYSPLKDFAGKRGSLSIPLTDRSGTRGLTLFTHDSGAWKAIGPVQMTPDGASAVIASAIEIPKTFAVLRRTGGDFQVFGALPANAAPSTDAARVMTEAIPVAYAPAADGSVNGGPATRPSGAGYGLTAAVSAPAGTNEAQAVEAILSDPNRLNAHVDRIAAEADRNQYDGIELNYPGVNPSQKANFTTFAQALATRLHASKRKLVLRLPLPRREGTNWNTGAYDWQALGKAADNLVLIAEYDQSIYRQRVPEAVKYLAGQVGDSRKLILEVTPYSEEKSDQGQPPRTLSTLEALSIAGQITVRDRDQVVTGADVVVSADNVNRENGSGPQWTSQGVVSFQYRSGNEQRTVWIENIYSVGYKLELIELDKLGGVAVDDASANPSITNIWPAIEQYQSTGAPLIEQPNPQSLRPQWLADGRPIPDAGNRAQITWRAPAQPGKYTLTVIVSDGTMRVASSTTVDVRAGTPSSQPAGTPGPGGTTTPGARATPVSTRAAPAPSRAPSATSR